MIDILMATYNGEKYLAEQIDSILNQTNSDWNLLIQDDCSTDGTAVIAKEYQHRFYKKVKFVARETASGSAKNNFFSMLSLSKAGYCMTADQDDVWMPEKLDVTLKAMRDMEEIYGVNAPLLVHTDLRVVDEKLQVISYSMFQRQSLNCSRDRFNNLLAQNIVTGCTMMANRALLVLIDKIPQEAIMHDRWFALVAAAFGRIAFVESPTVLYRQHNHNLVGARNAKSCSYNLRRLLNYRQAKEAIRRTYAQANAFLEVYGKILPPHLAEIAEAYGNISQHRYCKRIKILNTYDFWKTGLASKFGQILFA